MRTSIFMLIVALVLALAAIAITAILSYHWSFTETTFGGWLGFAIPPLMACVSFVAGAVFNSATSELAVPTMPTYGDEGMLHA